MRGLRRRVDHQLEVRGDVREDAVDAVGVADVELDGAELARELRDQAVGDVARRRLGPEEARAHVVLDPDDVVARGHEVTDGFRPDQATRAGDDRDGHPSEASEALLATSGDCQRRAPVRANPGSRLASCASSQRNARRSRRLAGPGCTARLAFLLRGFYATLLGLDRRRYVHEYRNDFVWNYTEALRAHGVDVITYVPSHDHDGLDEAADGFVVRFLPLSRTWRRLERGFRLAKTPGRALRVRGGPGALAPAGCCAAGSRLTTSTSSTFRSTGRAASTCSLSRAPCQLSPASTGARAACTSTLFKRAALRAGRRDHGSEHRRAAPARALRLRGASSSPTASTADSSPRARRVDRPPRVLVVARLDDEQKRISDLISAVARLPSPWALDIVGRGPDEQHAARGRAAPRLADRVAFHGWVDSREELRETTGAAASSRCPPTGRR